MDENRLEGTFRSASGKAQEAVGSVTGDARMRAEGLQIKLQGLRKIYTDRPQTLRATRR